MCGIVCLVSKHKNGFFYPDLSGVFEQMLFADTLRGKDGTGVFYNVENKIKSLKIGGTAETFMATPEWSKAFQSIFQKGRFVVGHNRAATKGEKTTENAHPFQEGPITLVHNGTLNNHKHLAETEVDSHAIAVSIAKEGIKETVKKISGAYTLVWSDAKQKTLNIIRNYQRPLWKFETKDFFLFCSEKKLGEWILDRNKEAITLSEEVKPHTLYQFNFDDFTKYHTQEVSPYPPSTGYHSNLYDEDDWYHSNNFGRKTYPPTQHYPTKKEDTTPPKGSGSVVPWNPGVAQTSQQQTQQSQSGTGTKTSTSASRVPVVGEVIAFKPIEVDKKNKTKLWGEYIDLSGLVHTVIAWLPVGQAAGQFLQYIFLRGRVKAHAYDKNAKKGFIVIDGELSGVKEAGGNCFQSKNGIKMTLSGLNRLPHECSLCGIHVSHMLIHNCEVNMEHNEIYCPHCSADVEVKAELNKAKGAI
jgi:hypothetical protein